MKKILPFVLGALLCFPLGNILAQEEELTKEVTSKEEVVPYEFKINKLTIESAELPVLGKKAKSSANSAIKWAKIEADLIALLPQDKKKSKTAKVSEWIGAVEVEWFVGVIDRNKNSPTAGKIICLNRKVQYSNIKASKSEKDALPQKVAIFISPKVLERYGYNVKSGRFSNSDFVVYAEIFYAGERVAVPTEKILKVFSEAKNNKTWWKKKDLKKDENSPLRKYTETPFWGLEAWEVAEESL